MTRTTRNSGVTRYFGLTSWWQLAVPLVGVALGLLLQSAWVVVLTTGVFISLAWVWGRISQPGRNRPTFALIYVTPFFVWSGAALLVWLAFDSYGSLDEALVAGPVLATVAVVTAVALVVDYLLSSPRRRRKPKRRSVTD